MVQSFGERLYTFSKTIDLVKDNTLDEIKNIIKDYTSTTLEIKHVRIMLDAAFDNKVWLYKHSLGGDMKINSPQSIKDKDGNFKGQMSFAYSIGKPLWIVCKNKSNNLRESFDYIDLWSREKKIPNYVTISNDDIKTSIIIPISDGDGKCGVVNFETLEYLDITKEAKKELIYIAKTISILFSLAKFDKSTKVNTSHAIISLRKSLQENNYPKLTKPKIFLASSNGAEADVVDIIRKVITKYENKFKLIYWKDNHNPGNINQQLLNDIASCRYGICYLSEKHEKGMTPKYRDNANVIFEAGILHGKNDSGSDSISSWLPIREVDSPLLPFDFAAERMIKVPRLIDGELHTELFEKSLEKSLFAMLA